MTLPKALEDEIEYQLYSGRAARRSDALRELIDGRIEGLHEEERMMTQAASHPNPSWTPHNMDRLTRQLVFLLADLDKSTR